ncbi:MAG: lipopolysaccharide biosynthesis protein [Eggerthellaceae bacterium]|nr:lipopolysaccharide biosynthesis protein [Eggerthellaceae bacterium]
MQRLLRARKPLLIERLIRTWGGRILGAMREDGLSAADEAYESNQTSRDFLWNTIGLSAWGIVFPVLTVVITQLVGAEEAGKFALAFVAGHLLMFVANYGVRTYQVSDRDEAHQFIDYQVNRWITCAIMILAGWLFCRFRGYDSAMATMSMAVFVYKMIDGMADVYEGRLQQMDKLYLAGISQAIRSLGVLVFFSAFLLFTRSLEAASIAMAIAAVLSLVLGTLPLALLETPKSGKFSPASLGRLFMHCAPVFLALFLYAFIDNMPKFMMEGVLTYDNQLYFNALYFPAQTILMIVGFMYKPLLTRMADAWNDLSRRKRFDLFIAVALGVIVLITVVAILLMRWIGIPILSFLYGLDFEPFRKLSYLMLVAGGITGGIDFLYQVVTVMRRQAVVTKLYLITFVFALVIPYMLIRVSQLEGAVVSYVIVMAILFLLLGLEYIGVRLGFAFAAESREPHAEPARPRTSSTKRPRNRVRPRPSVKDE